MSEDKHCCSYTYLHLWGNKGFVFHPDGLPGLTQPHKTHTRKHRDAEVEWKKKKEMEEKNLDPCGGLCVGTGEQFVLQNSHYQHSAAGLQLAGVERSVAWPNERLIFLPFVVKMQIRAASHWKKKKSSRLLSTFPIFRKIVPLNCDNVCKMSLNYGIFLYIYICFCVQTSSLNSRFKEDKCTSVNKD